MEHTQVGIRKTNFPAAEGKKKGGERAHPELPMRKKVVGKLSFGLGWTGEKEKRKEVFVPKVADFR